MGVQMGRPKLPRERLKLSRKDMEVINEDAIRLIRASPCYFYSFSGHKIFRDYYRKHKITIMQAQLLVIFSYHKFFMQKDLETWGYYKKNGINLLNKMEELGFIMKLKVSSHKSHMAKRNALILAEAGRRFIDGYEEYYDARMKQIFGVISKVGANPNLKKVLQKKTSLEKQLDKQLWEQRILKKKVVQAPIQAVQRDYRRKSTS